MTVRTWNALFVNGPVLASDVQAWKERAACRGLWAAFDDESAEGQRGQQRLCERCLVRDECLEDVLSWEAGQGVKSRFLVVGGLLPAERYALAVDTGLVDRGKVRVA